MDLNNLIARMTREEKCALLSGGTQFTSKSIPRLGIPAVCFSDGPGGIRKQAGAADHLGLNPSLPATGWPSASTLANSWDTSLLEQVGTALGEEAAALGVDVLLAPGLNIKRSPLCGRNFEYYSEDPYLSGKLAAACIRGVQAGGAAACPKHFAVNSQETLRMHSDSVLDERTLREIYLTGFEIAVREGKPRCVMSSYNRVNGTYASENRKLLRDILVDEWGFDGFVVTDWGGGNDRVSSLLAGGHMEMPATGGSSDREVLQALRSGRVDEAWLDRIVAEYLKVCFDITGGAARPDGYDRSAHHAAARRAAAESAVLLKNEGGLLPLAAGTRVAVIGAFADKPRIQGGGSSSVTPTRVDRPLDCLAESGLNVIGWAEGFRRGHTSEKMLAEAVALAARAEVVLVYPGLDELTETEGMDRPDMAMPACQTRLMEALHSANSNLVVVLAGGAPMELPWFDLCAGLLYGGLGGQAGAGAAVDILTGRTAPSGKLAESWPLRTEDTPCFRCYPGKEKTAEYREGIYVGYRYYDTVGLPVRFPFGFGLSYTDFAYSKLSVAPDAVTFTLTNTGRVAGAEIAQIYVSRRESAVFRPERELKGFAKVYLEPGESRTVTVALDDKAFRFFHVGTGRWEREEGSYEIHVGASSRDIRLTGRVFVEGTQFSAPYDPALLPSYFSGRAADVSDEEFSTLLGRPLPPGHWDRSAPLEANDTFSQLSYAGGLIGRLVYRVFKGQVDRAEKRGVPDLNALFRLSMPFRSIAKMTGGLVDRAMTDALVEIFNGHFCRGTGHLLSAWHRKRRAENAAERHEEETAS